MFTKLISALWTISTTGLTSVFTYFLKFYLEHKKSFDSIFAALVVLGSWILWSLGHIKDLLAPTIEGLGKIAVLIADADPELVTNSEIYGQMDSFFPLTELFAAMSLYMGVAVAVFAARSLLQVYKLIPFKAS